MRLPLRKWLKQGAPGLLIFHLFPTETLRPVWNMLRFQPVKKYSLWRPIYEVFSRRKHSYFNKVDGLSLPLLHGHYPASSVLCSCRRALFSMPGCLTPGKFLMTCHNAIRNVAFRVRQHVRLPSEGHFGAQSLQHTASGLLVCCLRLEMWVTPYLPRLAMGWLARPFPVGFPPTI